MVSQMDVRLSGLAAGLTAGGLLAALAACTSEEPAEPAAREVAQSYVRLIATGSGTELEQLWQATASDRSADIRRAGRILAEAEQRIEVIEVGEAEPVDGSVDVPFDSDLDSGNARQVTVSYQLAGTSYDGRIVLAPHEDLPLEDPQA